MPITGPHIRRAAGAGALRSGSRLVSAATAAELVLRTDGVDGWVSVDDDNLLDTFAGNAFTIVGLVRVRAWPTGFDTTNLVVKSNNAGAYSYWIGLGDGDNGDSSFALLVTDRYPLHGRYSNPPIDRWVQWATVVDLSLAEASKIRSYVNTNLLANVMWGAGAIPGTVPATNGKLTLGCWTDLTPGGFLDADWLDWRIYPSALTEANLRTLLIDGIDGSVLQLPLRGTLKDASGNDLDGTAHDGATFTRRVGKLPKTLVRVHFIGDSRCIGFDEQFDPTYAAVRGGLRRHMGNKLALYGIAMRGVGSQTVQGGWSHNHDAYSGKWTDLLQVDGVYAGSPALTPDYVVHLIGLNDARAAGDPIAPQYAQPIRHSTITRQAYARAFDDLYTGHAPRVIQLIEPGFCGGYNTNVEERIRGISEWQRNHLGFEQRALGRAVREFDSEPWVQADNNDAGGSQFLHPKDPRYQILGEGAADMVIAWPAAPAQAPYLDDLDTLVAGTSGKVQFVIDGRDKPAETDAFHGYCTTVYDLIGTNNAVQTVRVVDAAGPPRWEGGSLQFEMNAYADGMYKSMDIPKPSGLTGLRTFAIRFREAIAFSAWGDPYTKRSALFAIGDDTNTSFYCELKCPDASHTQLHVHARTGVAKYTSVYCDITAISDTAIHDVIVEFDEVDPDAPSSYDVTIDGTPYVMTTGADSINYTSVARGEGVIGGASNIYLLLYGYIHKLAAGLALTAPERAVLASWMQSELGTRA